MRLGCRKELGWEGIGAVGVQERVRLGEGICTGFEFGFGLGLGLGRYLCYIPIHRLSTID